MVISPWRRLRAHMKINLIERAQAAFAAGAFALEADSRSLNANSQRGDGAFNPAAQIGVDATVS
jgi:hypothetical protein